MQHIKKGMRCYKLMLWKAYFEKGYGLTSYVKWAMAIVGITAMSIPYILIGAILYGVSCFFIGWAWYHYNIITAEIEVNNQFNLFVREMRRKRKI